MRKLVVSLVPLVIGAVLISGARQCVLVQFPSEHPSTSGQKSIPLPKSGTQTFPLTS